MNHPWILKTKQNKKPAADAQAHHGQMRYPRVRLGHLLLSSEDDRHVSPWQKSLQPYSAHG